MLNNLKNIIFVLASFFLVFFILEIICSFFFIYNSNYHGPLIKIFTNDKKSIEEKNIQGIKINKFTNKMQPGVYLIDNIKYNINSKGFRGKEFSEKNDKNCRIISLGGSITLGLEKSYPSILEEKLNQKGLDCESLNFGMTSKGLNYIEDLIINEAVNYSPNFITIMTNRNATMYDSYGSSSVAPDIITNNFQYNIYKINKYLFSNLMIYRFVDLSYRRVISWLYSDENKIANPYNPRAFHLKNYFELKYLNQLNNIIQFCKKNNIKIILIKEAYYIDPTYQKNLEATAKNEIIKKLLTYDKEKNKEKLFWMYTNAILNISLDETKKNNPNIIVIDPTAELYKDKKSKNFTNDGSHLTNNGHEIVADEIFRSIMKNLSL
tara:strand:+ start:2528 stop:3664 length:1137 start_codon:yes stop_codon:yes gene_type:complete